MWALQNQKTLKPQNSFAELRLMPLGLFFSTRLIAHDVLSRCRAEEMFLRHLVDCLSALMALLR